MTDTDHVLLVYKSCQPSCTVMSVNVMAKKSWW